jgi:cell division protein FtsZ
MLPDQNDYDPVQIKVIGIGGCGCNIVNGIAPQMQGFEFFSMDTNVGDLKEVHTTKLITLGIQSLASKATPESARRLAELADRDIRAALAGAHMTFVIAGMGGATGTGAISVIAHIAKCLKVQAVGIVVLPFEFESDSRQRHAKRGITELKPLLDKLVVMPNQSLFGLGDSVSQDTAFSHMNNEIRECIENLSCPIGACDTQHTPDQGSPGRTAS